MSRALAALAALALCLGLLAGCGEDEQRDFVGDANFEVELPQGWSAGSDQVMQQTANAALGSGLPDEVQIELLEVFSKPPQDGFATNVNVFREPVPGVSSEQYVEFSIRSIEQASGAQVERAPGPSIGGEPSEQFDYSASFGAGKQLRIRTLTTFRDDYAYNVTLTATAAGFAEAEAALGQIISSWRWTG